MKPKTCFCINGVTGGPACSFSIKKPGTHLSYKATLKSLMPLKVLHSLPSIGLELYQMGVHIRAKEEESVLILVQMNKSFRKVNAR